VTYRPGPGCEQFTPENRQAPSRQARTLAKEGLEPSNFVLHHLSEEAAVVRGLEWPYSALAAGDRQEYCCAEPVIKLSYKMKIIKEGNATVKVYACSYVSITLPASP
jgi:hypothetical protein